MNDVHLAAFEQSSVSYAHGTDDDKFIQQVVDAIGSDGNFWWDCLPEVRNVHEKLWSQYSSSKYIKRIVWVRPASRDMNKDVTIDLNHTSWGMQIVSGWSLGALVEVMIAIVQGIELPGGKIFGQNLASKETKHVGSVLKGKTSRSFEEW